MKSQLVLGWTLASTAWSQLSIPTKEIALGVNMPVLSIGTGGLGRKNGGEITKNWLALGGHGIDSAQGYGNEGDVKAAIQQSGVKRSELFITSKISSLTKVAAAVESELEKLGQDYFDLLLVHEPNGDFKTGWKELEGLVKSGKLKAIGVSNFKVKDLEKLLPYTTIKPAVNQIRTNIYCHEDDVIAFCKEHGITVEAWSPLDGKHECSKAGSIPHDPSVVAIANAHKVSSYQVGLKWIVQHGWLTTFQSTDQSHQKEDADLFSFNLTDDEMSKLDHIQKSTPETTLDLGEGLTLEELKAGDGVTFPRAGDKLTMHYTGTLAKGGKQFDSSVGGAPFEFTVGVGEVIKGWDLGVMKMSLGEKANLHVPSALGYGEEGAGGVIPPNADLNFQVELLDINSQKEQAMTVVV